MARMNFAKEKNRKRPAQLVIRSYAYMGFATLAFDFTHVGSSFLLRSIGCLNLLPLVSDVSFFGSVQPIRSLA